jgi:hypothetical protein
MYSRYLVSLSLLRIKKAPQATDTFKEPIVPNIGSLAFRLQF